MERIVLPARHWSALEAAHGERADRLLAGHLARRARHERHPVEDFLHTYYRHSPGRFRRWHPGPGVVLEGAAGMPRAGWRFYRTDDGAVTLDVAAFLAARGATVEFVRSLLAATLARPAAVGCFALHEWAMVYRLGPEQVRHTGLPLRLGHEATDAVVEDHQIRCSHFDAFRFFTEPARPHNGLQPTRESQVALEQPGCLHAGMDLYKWSYKLTPAIPSELVADAFELARDIRVLDMQASPYDVRSLGLEAVAVETAEGKAAFVAAQRVLTQRGNALRGRILDAMDTIDAVAAGDGDERAIPGPDRERVRAAAAREGSASPPS